MKQLLDRRLLPIAIVTLALWISVGVLTGRWISLRGRVPPLLAEVEEVVPEPEPPAHPKIPFDRGTTVAPLTLRLVQVCRAAGVDTFSYVAYQGDSEPIGADMYEYLLRIENPGSSQGAGVVRRQHAVLATMGSYRRIRDLLELLDSMDPPVTLRRLEMHRSSSLVEMEAELVGLCLEI